MDFLLQKEEETVSAAFTVSSFPCPGLGVLAQRCRCTMCSMAAMVISQ